MRVLPLKWLPPEIMVNDGESLKFTPAADVVRKGLLEKSNSVKSSQWSFGVCMWEIMTRGAVPFGDCSGYEAQERTRNGVRLPSPPVCTEEM